MKKTFKFAALLLAVVLVISLMPIKAFAENTEDTTPALLAVLERTFAKLQEDGLPDSTDLAQPLTGEKADTASSQEQIVEAFYERVAAQSEETP